MKTIQKFSNGFCNFMKINIYEKKNYNKNVHYDSKTYNCKEIK